MKIVMGADHVGLILKEPLKKWLIQKGFEVIDLGTNSPDSTDYPIFGKLVGEYVANNKEYLGILVCGTGVGICLASNKVKGIRAVVCSEPYTAKLSKEHNDTNVLAIGSRVVGFELAKMIIEQWLAATFEGGRHQKRIDMYK